MKQLRQLVAYGRWILVVKLKDRFHILHSNSIGPRNTCFLENPGGVSSVLRGAEDNILVVHIMLWFWNTRNRIVLGAETQEWHFHTGQEPLAATFVEQFRDRLVAVRWTSQIGFDFHKCVSQNSSFVVLFQVTVQ